MQRSLPKVVVIGAGIMGATTAFYLAESGMDVTLFEAQNKCGSGVTRHSFGWINSINIDPHASPELYRLAQRSFEHYQALNEMLGGMLYGHQYGSIFWRKSFEETKSLYELHANAGGHVKLLGPDEFKKKVSLAQQVPGCAVFSTRDLALDPIHVTKTLLGAAKSRGVNAVYECDVTRLDVRSGKIAGVMVAGRYQNVDAVIVAAGTQSQQFLKDVTSIPQIKASPAALIKTSAIKGKYQGGIKPIIRGPDFEMRDVGNGQLAFAESVQAGQSEADLVKVGENTLQRASEMFPHLNEARVQSAGIGNRPWPENPLVGRATDIENLYLAVMHPGFIAAPEVAMIITAQIQE